MELNEEERIHSGRVKFKAGFISKWKTVHCSLYQDSLLVYHSPDDSEPMATFTSGRSWISAKKANGSSLFVLNETDRSSATTKIYLFDTESTSLLHSWLLAFKSGGWTAAIVGEKFHYRKQSIDSHSARNRPSKNRSAYRDLGFGGSLRGTRSISEPTFFVKDRSIIGSDDTDLFKDTKGTGIQAWTDLSTIFSKIDINRKKNSFQPTQSSLDAENCLDGNSKEIETLKSRSNTDDRPSYGRNDVKLTEEGANGDVESKEFTITNSEDKLDKNVHGPRVVDVSKNEIVDERKKNFYFEGSKDNEKIHSSDEIGYSSLQLLFDEKTQKKRPIESNVTNSPNRMSRLGRFDHSKIFFDPAISPDMKGKLLQAECRSRKTSLTRQGEHILLSEKDETDVLEIAYEEKMLERNNKGNVSKLSSMIEVTNIDTGEKKTISARVTPTRKTSSVASEGDLEAESSVFHNGPPGSHLSYLESGYCSKESLSTNESYEQRKSSSTTEDDVKNEVGKNRRLICKFM